MRGKAEENSLQKASMQNMLAVRSSRLIWCLCLYHRQLSLISLSARNECWWQRCQQRFVPSSAGEHYLPVRLCYRSAPKSPPPHVCPSQPVLPSNAEANGDVLNHSAPLLQTHTYVSPLSDSLNTTPPSCTLQNTAAEMFSLGRNMQCLPTWLPAGENVCVCVCVRALAWQRPRQVVQKVTSACATLQMLNSLRLAVARPRSCASLPRLDNSPHGCQSPMGPAAGRPVERAAVWKCVTGGVCHRVASSEQTKRGVGLWVEVLAGNFQHH